MPFFFMQLSPYIQIRKQTKRMEIPRSQLKKKKKPFFETSGTPHSFPGSSALWFIPAFAMIYLQLYCLRNFEKHSNLNTKGI